MVSGGSSSSENRTLNRKFPILQSLIQSGMSPKGIWVLWWLKHLYFESQIQWFKVSYTQGFSLVVSMCSSGSETRTLNRNFPMVQILIQPGMSPSGIWVFGGSETCTLNRKIPTVQSVIQSLISRSGIWVLRWLRTPYFELQIPNGSKSHTVRDVPHWHLGALVPQNPVL